MTAPIPGDGFRIATGFLEVVADQSKAEKQVDRFLRDTDKHMGQGGQRGGRSFGLGFLRGMLGPLAGIAPMLQKLVSPIAGLFQKALGAAFQLTKFGLMAGVAATAVAGLASAVASSLP